MPDLASADLSTHMQDYLEAIYQMQLEHQVARVRDIAQRLKVKMPSVSGALKALKARELVNHESYGYITLTPEGEHLARQVYQRHQAIVGFLQRIMMIEAERAEVEACGLEHALSAEALERLVALTQFMQTDESIREQWLRYLQKAPVEETPGEVVAPPVVAAPVVAVAAPVTVSAPVQAEAEECEVEEVEPADTRPRTSLDQAAPGTVSRIVKVCGQGAIRRRLLDMGLRPGAEVKVERLAPLGDPMEVTVMEYHLTLRREEAAEIEVVILQQALVDVEPGASVTVVEVQGTAGRKRRLLGMGLQAGARLEVRKSAEPNTVAMSVEGNEVHLASVIAQDISVRREE
ncbi:MAG: metal-dependent transcriptional regulator [Armatimonadia bacterium]